MRLPRFRLTVRVMMVFVAVTALGMGAWVLHGRAKEYRRRGNLFARWEKNYQLLNDGDSDFLKSQDDFMDQQKKTLIQLRLGLASAVKKNLFKRTIELQEQAVERQSRFVAEQSKFDESFKKGMNNNHAMAAYSKQLKDKYYRAASYPWLGVADDPPPPVLGPRAGFWLAKHRFDLALADYDELLKQAPDNPGLYNDRAWIWATSPDPRFRDGKRAVESATRACELAEQQEPAYLDTLAAAYAESGDFAAAIRWEQETLDRTPSNSPSYPECRSRLKLYQAGKPYRDDRPSLD